MGHATRLCLLGLSLLAFGCGDDSEDPVTMNPGPTGGVGGGVTGGTGGVGGGTGGGVPGGTGGGVPGGTGGGVPGGTGGGAPGGTGGGTGGEATGGGAGAGTGGAPPTGLCSEDFYPAPDLLGAVPTQVHTDGAADLLEGPVWVESQAALYFSGMSWSGAGNILKLVPPSTVSTFAGGVSSNGLAVDPAGNLVVCDTGAQVVSSYNPADATPLGNVASDFQGATFHSPNDLIYRSDGTLYFTDPDWNGTGTVAQTGVYRVPPGGAAELVEGTLSRPNGITLSIDETVLYVGDWNGGGANGRIGAYAVNPDGSLGARTELAGGLSSPDGMTVDCGGNLYATEHETGLIHVYAPTGAELGTISVSTSLTNLAFGGADGMTLYATAGTGVYAIPMNLPGRPY